MARTGRPKAEVTLTAEEQATLEHGARRAKSSQVLAMRSRIVLGCADGMDTKQIAAELRVPPDTVSKWRNRFIRLRLDGLIDEQRPGRPPSIPLEQSEQVVVATVQETPRGATPWSRASMAQRSGSSKSTIGRIGLEPHQGGVTLSTDPLLEGRRRGRALPLSERAVVLGVDEKSQRQAVDRSQPVPGEEARAAHP
jgi:transposase